MKATVQLELISNIKLNQFQCCLSEKGSCCFIIGILRNLNNELERFQTFGTLLASDESAEKLLESFFTLENLKSLKSLKAQLQKTIKIQKKIAKQDEVKIVDVIWSKKIASQLKTSKLKEELNINKKMISCEIEQHELRFEKISMENQEFFLKVAVDQHAACDTATVVLHFYREKIKDLQIEIKRVEKDYDARIDAIEMEFQGAEGEKRRLLAKIQQERELFETRQKDIDKYLETKRKKEAERKLREIQGPKIILIQAWWRGYMVVKILGRFKAFKKRTKAIKKDFVERRKKKNKGKK